MKTLKETEVLLSKAKKELKNAKSDHDVAHYGGIVQALELVLDKPLEEWPEI
jgi:hypothetical protein